MYGEAKAGRGPRHRLCGVPCGRVGPLRLDGARVVATVDKRAGVEARGGVGRLRAVQVGAGGEGLGVRGVWRVVRTPVVAELTEATNIVLNTWGRRGG